MKKPFYQITYVQVLFAIAVGVLLGAFDSDLALKMQPLGTGFIKLIKMIIAPVIFCTVVSGISGMENMKKLGTVGIKALFYFEVVSTFALVIGLVVMNVFKPGVGFTPLKAINPDDLSKIPHSTEPFSWIKFCLNIIPDTAVGAFTNTENILPVLLFAILFGYALARLGPAAKGVTNLINEISKAVFAIVGIIMKLAPIGAFGAMAYTIGLYGWEVLWNLAKLIGAIYLTSFCFVIVVLGLIAKVTGFSIFRFIAYIKSELLLVLGTSSSESALPALITKLQRLGCDKSVVGLVVPAGYSFNLDGTNIYMTMAALFLAQATNTDLNLGQQLVILLAAMAFSKGASGVTGAGFITLALTLQAVPGIPPWSMLFIFGVDRFLSECRALTNFVGNGVATIVVSAWEKELDRDKLQAELKNGAPAELDLTA